MHCDGGMSPGFGATLIRGLCILASISSASGATTVATIQNEGAACSAMAATIPRLKALTGMKSCHSIYVPPVTVNATALHNDHELLTFS